MTEDHDGVARAVCFLTLNNITLPGRRGLTQGREGGALTWFTPLHGHVLQNIRSFMIMRLALSIVLGVYGNAFHIRYQ